MRKLSAAGAAFVLALTLAQSAQAQRRQPARQQDAEIRALRQEVEQLREEQQAIRAELEEIKGLLQVIAENLTSARQRTVSVDDDPAVGESTARVVLIDFSDYQ